MGFFSEPNPAPSTLANTQHSALTPVPNGEDKATDIAASPTSDRDTQAQAILSSLPVDGTRYDAVARLSMPDALSGMAFSGITPSAHTMIVDTDREHGGEDAGPQPLDMLLVALGTCTGMDVISIMRKKRQKVTHYSVNVYANQAEEHPRIFTEIMVEHVVGGDNLDSRAMSRSLELSITKYCPVHALLSRATRVEHVYRILDPTPA